MRMCFSENGLFVFIEYSYGKIVELCNNYNEIKNKKISLHSMDGGWSRMDYTIKLKNKPTNEQIMKKFYFTFGFGQQYENCYVVIESETWGGAREEMVRRYGTKWSFQYTEDEWLLNPNDPCVRTFCEYWGVEPNNNEPITQADLYGLTEIK